MIVNATKISTKKEKVLENFLRVKILLYSGSLETESAMFSGSMLNPKESWINNVLPVLLHD